MSTTDYVLVETTNMASKRVSVWRYLLKANQSVQSILTVMLSDLIVTSTKTSNSGYYFFAQESSQIMKVKLTNNVIVNVLTTLFPHI